MIVNGDIGCNLPDLIGKWCLEFNIQLSAQYLGYQCHIDIGFWLKIMGVFRSHT